LFVEAETLVTSGKTRKAGATADTAGTAGENVAAGTKRRRSARNQAAEVDTGDAEEEEEATQPVQQKRRLVRKKKTVVESDGEDGDQ
jgi:hypothetical protein